MNSQLKRAAGLWLRISGYAVGLGALLWFVVRVVPKPSRASYPCQRMAFPVASSFVIWLCGTLALKTLLPRLMRRISNHRAVTACTGFVTLLAIGGWTLTSVLHESRAQEKKVATDYNFVPAAPNQPVGVARGIFPGRVVWAHDPLATKWAGRWKEKSDQWWLDENTDPARVATMLRTTLLQLTGAPDDATAWKAIFEHHNKSSRQLPRGYQPGEIVALKINVNNSERPLKTDNYIDAAPQVVLGMVRQLVNHAKVRPEDIVIYDVRRVIPDYILTPVWTEFKDVRFVQQSAPKPEQPRNPGYGDSRGLEGAKWVEGVAYSNGKYKDAKLITKQVFDATYLINMALLKGHSFPYNNMENGDEGQTGISMCGKNHFGSIKGPADLHPAINTGLEAGTPGVYSPIVDLAASPNLGAKTILYVMDALYCGRKWRSYPSHFPNAPFNNRVEPYENTDWPASVLMSMDGVALDAVGLDILVSQTKNNVDAKGQPRLLIRANADDYLFEMAQPEKTKSGVVYTQGGKPVASLGVYERWDGDATRRYSRNLDPKRGKGIELIYLPSADTTQPVRTAMLPGRGK